jgi:hypothetical protein
MCFRKQYYQYHNRIWLQNKSTRRLYRDFQPWFLWPDKYSLNMDFVSDFYIH